MTQNNFRKEPVFGEPLTSQESQEKVEQAQADIQNKNKTYFSLHSTKVPHHTFTPTMERSEPATDGPVDVFASKSKKEFQFTPSSDNAESVVKNIEENLSAEVPAEGNENVELEVQERFTTERIIPNVAVTGAGSVVEGTKTPDINAKIPPKTRRLLLLALLGLALLVLFFLLKPSTPETVEELQSQHGGSLPIEFRPVDEAEAKRAEEQARAEQEIVVQTQEKAQQDLPNPSAVSHTEQLISEKPVQNKPVVEQPAIKPKTEGSVVFQPESTPKSQPKTERVAPPAPKVAVRPVEKPPVKVEASKTNTTSAIATKTMTVPKGVSLMQVFRDNNLNISDVNSMSKANNIVSNLKVGERVTVRLDKNNRVVEMSIGSGGKFIRQSNGSYTFK